MAMSRAIAFYAIGSWVMMSTAYAEVPLPAYLQDVLVFCVHMIMPRQLLRGVSRRQSGGAGMRRGASIGSDASRDSPGSLAYWLGYQSIHGHAYRQIGRPRLNALRGHAPDGISEAFWKHESGL